MADLDGKIDFLYTNIGRGHPHYLDGIVEELVPDRVGTVTDVFEVPCARTRLAWRTVRFAYLAGAKGGLLSWTYNRLRSNTDYNRSGLPIRLLKSGLAGIFSKQRPLVVAHPLLIALLEDKPGLVYQHGEVVAPRESLVEGRHRIVVPLAQTADTFADAGFPIEQIFVSGLCIEPSIALLAERAFDERCMRLSGQAQLCGAFFSSGAEPRAHVVAAASAALSVSKRGGRAIVFARRAGRFERQLRASHRSEGMDYVAVASCDDLPQGNRGTVLCLYTEREGLNALTAAQFTQFDYFVAPPHERTGWALGLGLPMFVLDPPLGSFAPLNREVLIDAGVAKPLGNRAETREFADTLEAHRKSGELRQMCEAGWRRYDIRGFANIAAMLEPHS
jgi:hypothetical protein